MQGKVKQLTQTLSRIFHSRLTFNSFVALGLVLLLGGCLPSGEQDVNTDLFKDQQELATRSQTLQIGMSKEQAFNTLGVPVDKFDRLSMQDMQMCVYGNSQVQGTPAELEAFRRRMAAFEAYALPYREIKSSSSLGFGKMKVEKTGYDLRLVLVFDSGRMVRSSVEGTQNVRSQEDKYVWDMLINRGISAAL